MPKNLGVLVFTCTVICGKCASLMKIEPNVRAKTPFRLLKKVKAAGWRKTRKFGWVCDTALIGYSSVSQARESGLFAWFC